MKYTKALTILSLVSVPALADTAMEDTKEFFKTTKGISKVYAGFSNTTSNIGVSHERRKGSLGVDALVLSSGDNGSDGPGQKDRQLLVSSSLIHHLRDNSNADVFLGTGIAAMKHSDVSGTDDDKTTLGPLFRVGSSYYFDRKWSLGLEYMTALNWSNDDLASENTYGHLSLGYTY